MSDQKPATAGHPVGSSPNAVYWVLGGLSTAGALVVGLAVGWGMGPAAIDPNPVLERQLASVRFELAEARELLNRTEARASSAQQALEKAVRSQPGPAPQASGENHGPEEDKAARSERGRRPGSATPSRRRASRRKRRQRSSPAGRETTELGRTDRGRHSTPPEPPAEVPQAGATASAVGDGPTRVERIFVEFPDIGVAAAESKAVLTENAADFSIAWPVANLAPFREMAVEGRMALQYDESGRFGATRAIEVGGAVLEDYVLSWRWTAFNRTGSRFLEARTFLENLVKHATFEVIGHDQTGKKVQLLIPQTVLLEIGERVAVPGVWPDCEPTLVLVENEEWRANPPIDRVIGIVHRTGATFELALHSRKRGLEIRWLWNTELEEEFFAVQQDIRQKERELKGFKAQCATIKRLLKQDSASSSDRDSKPRSGRRPRPRPSRTQLRSLEMTCRGLETEIRTAQTKRKALAQARRLVRWDDDTIEEITDLPVVYLIAERSEVIIAKVEIVK